MILLEKRQINIYLAVASVIGAVGGAFLFFINPIIIFFVFVGTFIFGFIYVKLTDYIYKKYFFGGPPVHITKKSKEIILNTIKNFNLQKVIDLGSGNGGLCFLLAKNNINTYGIEMNFYYYLISVIRNLFTRKKVKFIFGNLWKLNFKDYDCLMIYPISYMLDKLESKILEEAKAGTIIVSYYLKFKNLNCFYNKDDVYFHQK